MAIAIGQKAPDFALKDQNGKVHKLSEYVGKKVILSFHPLAFTGVCAVQMQDLEKNKAAFTAKNTVALGLSIDSQFAKAAWSKELDIAETSLLADFFPHGKVAEDYGILREEGFSERAVFIIDEKGIVIFSKIYPIKELPDINELLTYL